jgi:hypothetical protein
MIKRSGAILLTLLYVVTVLGFALNLHYCGKIITSVQINAPSQSCIKDMMAGKMKCCKNKRIDIKIKDAHQSGSTTFLSKVFSFELAKLPFTDFFYHGQHTLAENYFDKAPPQPPPGSISVIVKNCTFRI